MKHAFTQGDCRAEYDTDAGTFTRWADNDVDIAETRPMTDGELASFELPAVPARVRELTDAVDELILNSLMGA